MRRDYDQGASAPYYEGRAAYLRGEALLDNPYEGAAEEHWDMGWRDEMIEHEQVEVAMRTGKVIVLRYD